MFNIKGRELNIEKEKKKSETQSVRTIFIISKIITFSKSISSSSSIIASMEAESMPRPHLLDILSTLQYPDQCWSPNTLKARITLNYRAIPYTQSFVSYPDIAPISQRLRIPARQDDEIQYTLPAIIHPASLGNANPAINDSVQIALHLEQVYDAANGHPSIFPTPSSLAIAREVESLLRCKGGAVDSCRPIVYPRVAAFLDERGREYFEYTRRGYRGIRISTILPKTEAEMNLVYWNVERGFTKIVEMLAGGNSKEGPFFEGELFGFADAVVLGVLGWFQKADQVLFERVTNLGDGALKRMWEASQQWMRGQGEEKSTDEALSEMGL